jgi:hypothetical protein
MARRSRSRFLRPLNPPRNRNMGLGFVASGGGSKAAPAYAGIAIVMITGNSDKDIVVGGIKAGAADFVVKPLDRDILIRKIVPASAARRFHDHRPKERIGSVDEVGARLVERFDRDERGGLGLDSRPARAGRVASDRPARRRRRLRATSRRRSRRAGPRRTAGASGQSLLSPCSRSTSAS